MQDFFPGINRGRTCMHTVSIHNIRKFTLIAAWLLVLVATPLAADTTITYQGQLHEKQRPAQRVGLE